MGPQTRRLRGLTFELSGPRRPQAGESPLERRVRAHSEACAHHGKRGDGESRRSILVACHERAKSRRHCEDKVGVSDVQSAGEACATVTTAR